MAETIKARADISPSGYQEHSQKHDYSYDKGLCVLPVAGREPAHRVIRLHGGVGLRTVKWRYERNGAPPLIPAFTDTYGDTILSGSVVPHMPRHNTTTRTYDWAVEGEYCYVQNDPRIAGENAFPAGEYPYPLPDQMSLASELAGQRASQVAQGGYDNPIDTLTEYVAANAPVVEGQIVWPLTAHPAAFTSSHLIGG